MLTTQQIVGRSTATPPLFIHQSHPGHAPSSSPYESSSSPCGPCSCSCTSLSRGMRSEELLPTSGSREAAASAASAPAILAPDIRCSARFRPLLAPVVVVPSYGVYVWSCVSLGRIDPKGSIDACMPRSAESWGHAVWRTGARNGCAAPRRDHKYVPTRPPPTEPAAPAGAGASGVLPLAQARAPQPASRRHSHTEPKPNRPGPPRQPQGHALFEDDPTLWGHPPRVARPPPYDSSVRHARTYLCPRRRRPRPGHGAASAAGRGGTPCSTCGSLLCL